MLVEPSVYNPFWKEGSAFACLHFRQEDGIAKQALPCYLLNFYVQILI